MVDKNPDFGGWVTKYNYECSDGKTILHDAFKHMDGKKVPLMWQHTYDSPGQILGHMILENRNEGVYGYGYFNETEMGKTAKVAVAHDDIDSLSIHANRLKMQGQNVLHGNLIEVSLVMAGANPGAFIDQVSVSHGDDASFDEAVIYTDEFIEHSVKQLTKESGEAMADKEESEEDMDTVNLQEVYDSMTDEQKALLTLVAEKTAAEVRNQLELEQNELEKDEADAEKDDEDEVEEVEKVVNVKKEKLEVKHSSILDDDEVLTHIDNKIQEGINEMSRNVFDSTVEQAQGATLTHSQLETIVQDAQRLGSLKESFLTHAQEYGIEDIDVLFPDAKALNSTPELLARRTEWVSEVLGGTKHSPFSRVKSVVADITADEARARGYVKNTEKKDEVIALLKRTTAPTTVYKKQKLDRDDVVDIVDLDVVAWLKGEMRLMLDEELARAILLGDGRESDDADKIKDPAGSRDGVGIRSIANDHDMYAKRITVDTLEGEDLVDQVILGRTYYRGSGDPTLFTTDEELTKVLLSKDTTGRRLYKSVEEVASAARVSKIVTVEAMSNYPKIAAIVAYLPDYTVGADKGGQVSMFDDFDIDYNQQKYLIETRVSGALTKPRSALVFARKDAVVVEPEMPSYDSSTKTLMIQNTPGVEYRIDGDPVRGQKKITATTEVTAHAKPGFTMKDEVNTTWTFTI